MALILQLDSNGQPGNWISWQDAAVYYAKNLVSWSLGEYEMLLRGGQNRMTGQQSIIKTSSIIAVKGASFAKRKNSVPVLNNRELFRRDNCLCAYCGKVFKENRLSRDHILPKSRGGRDTWMNCVTACNTCNQKKDNKTPEESNMQLIYVPYTPNRAEHLMLQNKSILFDQMQFLLSFIPEKSRMRNYVDTMVSEDSLFTKRN